MNSSVSTLLSNDDLDWPSFIGFSEAVPALEKGGVLDALESRIGAVEQAGLSSVGPSGVPDKGGHHTMDAGLMTGWDLLSASIGAIQNVRHPFSVARQMLDKQKRSVFPHNFLVGHGAFLFAERCGAALLPNKKLPEISQKNLAHDTVGCIVGYNDQWAVGTSTSGWGGKEIGRLGDAPVVGGGFCANKSGAAFCTWTGEIASRLSLSARAVIYLEMGKPLNEAMDFAFAPMKQMDGGHRDGVILHIVSPQGAIVAGCGFSSADIPATYSFWRSGMKQPERRPVPVWKSNSSALVF